jgi:hypothetical protein
MQRPDRRSESDAQLAAFICLAPEAKQQELGFCARSSNC